MRINEYMHTCLSVCKHTNTYTLSDSPFSLGLSLFFFSFPPSLPPSSPSLSLSLCPPLSLYLSFSLSQVNEILEACLSRGANGSALLLGPRGAGKSAVLQQALGALAAKYTFPGFLVVLCARMYPGACSLSVRA